MLFKCGHNHAHGAHHAPASDAGARAARVDQLGVRTVDIHCHLHVPEVDSMLQDAFDLKSEPLL